jgi:hypothetical protein
MDNNVGPIFNVCYLLPIFKDFAEAIHDGLIALGYSSFFNQSTIINEAQNIIFGAHLIQDQSNIPASSIIFNLEQLESDSQYCNERYFACLATHTVWDYSQRNVNYLKNQQINSAAVLVPLGFSRSLCRIEKTEMQDIDVLFYGAMNERRKKVLDDLSAAGLHVISLIGVYGAELDHYIARSKTVLNLHFHASKIFEIVRVGFLLNNKKAVVAEVDADTEIDPALRAAIVGVDYDQLVPTLVSLVRNDQLRFEAEETGFRIFSQRTQSEFLKQALIHE